MDMKIYKKTRYQNIYKHKNGNYVISMSKPVKTSISRVDGKKITSIDEAIKIRDNVSIRQQKAIETLHKEDFDTLWDKYIDDCKYAKKQAYNTIARKSKTYNKYLKGKITIPMTKTNKDFWTKFINNIDCSIKQKNQIIKTLRAFFNWNIKNNFICNNPVQNISYYKIEKTEMKYWVPQELKSILNVINEDKQSTDFNTRKNAYIVGLIIVIGFSLGDRIGETRALTYDCISEKDKTIRINHSINYDTKSNDFVSNTKTYSSDRIVDITDKLINEVKEYKEFLKIDCEINVKDTDLILFNYKINKPYSDVILRRKFYYYCNKANVTKIRIYDLRHTYVATMMAEGKELYQFSKRIGHSNINTTISKYGHLSNEIRKEIAQSTDKYI